MSWQETSPSSKDKTSASDSDEKKVDRKKKRNTVSFNGVPKLDALQDEMDKSSSSSSSITSSSTPFSRTSFIQTEQDPSPSIWSNSNHSILIVNNKREAKRSLRNSNNNINNDNNKPKVIVDLPSFQIPSSTLEKIKDWKINIIASNTSLKDGASRIHKYKDGVLLEDAIQWLIEDEEEHNLNMNIMNNTKKPTNATIIFTNNSSITIKDGIYENLEEEETN